MKPQPGDAGRLHLCAKAFQCSPFLLYLTDTARVRHSSETFTMLRIVLLVTASKGSPVSPGESKNLEGRVPSMRSWLHEEKKKKTSSATALPCVMLCSH